jgi:hypothetical protein
MGLIISSNLHWSIKPIFIILFKAYVRFIYVGNPVV